MTPAQKEAQEAVRAAGGNISKAARALGITRSGLRNRLKRAGVRTGPSGRHAETPDPEVASGLELRAQTTHVNSRGDLIDRYDKTGLARPDEPAFEPVPASHHVVKTTTRIDADGRVGMQYITSKPEAAALEAEIKASIEAYFKEHPIPAKRTRKPPEAKGQAWEDLLTTYHLGDPHVGLLSWMRETGADFDLKIAKTELVECARLLVDRAPRTKRAIVVNLGDFFHAEDSKQRTPKGGNVLDVDSRPGKVGEVGLSIAFSIIDHALQKHEIVEWRSLPGNHDPVLTWWLQQCVREHYRNEPRVIVHDASNPYQFQEWGEVLLGWCHGDGAKIEALGEIMACDAREAWGRTRFHYWHSGHVHHLAMKELRDCVVTTHRTLASADAWHHHAGYRSGKSLQVTTYHRKFGLDMTATVGVERVRAALKGSK